MKDFPKKDGFTLVELMVSMGITVILMVGMTAFFSSTFKNMFVAREKVANTQGQFVVNAIVNGKFVNTNKLQQLGPGGSYAVLRNDMNRGDLPFTFIGTQAHGSFDQIIFKDFFVFNGKDGNESSQGATDTDSQPIDNPGGLTELNNDYYLTAPLENRIYRCTSANPIIQCSDLAIDGLDQPMDIADNGKAAPNDLLYISDAKKNRIVIVRDPTGAKASNTEITGDFNYPTGVEFYSNGVTDYLFVADTYNHLVKKVNLSTNEVTIVAGDGNDEACDNNGGRDHTALYCKLSFPTGLMIFDDGNGDELYISDTGNGRVLKVRDPGPASDDVKFIANLENNTKISKVDFILPNGSNINTVQEGVSGNTLHKGKYTDNGLETITYNLMVTYTTQDITQTACVPGPCMDNFRGFFLNSGDDIFEMNDDVEIEGFQYYVSSLMSPTNIRVTPWNTTLPGDGKDVTVTKTFSSGDYSFFIDLSGVTLPGGFQQISIVPYDETPVALAANIITLRIGDGELGTPEDIIEFVQGGYDFPTGLGWNLGPDVSATADYSINFSNYDYTSNFDVDHFRFDEPNLGDILELNFNALLGKDSEGADIWDNFTLNADINP